MSDSADATFALAWTGFFRDGFFNFSMNRNIEEKNLKAESLIAQRRIYDFIHSVGGLFNLNVDKPILKVASSAYSGHIYSRNSKRQRKMINWKENVIA